MKINIIAVILLLSGFYTTLFSQVTDAEKNLRTQSADTTLGWKKGGVFSLNLAQTSGSLVQFKEILGEGFSYNF